MLSKLAFLCLWTIYLASSSSWLARAQVWEETSLVCPTDTDQQFKGLVWDCTSMDIGAITALQLPANVSSLILNNNRIHTIQNYSFSLSTSLKLLSLRNNRLLHIERFAFDGLDLLEVLDLQDNDLLMTGSPWTDGLFKSLSSLRELRLAYNSPEQGPFPHKLLLGLDQLETLTLQTSTGPLKFNHALSNVSQLRDVAITGDMSEITNDSFAHFDSLPLLSLVIRVVWLLEGIEINAFQSLRHLQSLSIAHTYLSLGKIMESLYPFRFRNMTELSFWDIGNRAHVNWKQVISGILDVHKTRYLSQICVERFVLRHSGIYVVGRGALTSPLWRQCLKTLDLSENPLVADRLALQEMHLLHSLQYVSIAYIRLKPLFPHKENENWLNATHNLWRFCPPGSSACKPEGTSSPQGIGVQEDQVSSLASPTPSHDDGQSLTDVTPALAHAKLINDSSVESQRQSVPSYRVSSESRGAGLAHTMSRLSHGGSWPNTLAHDASRNGSTMDTLVSHTDFKHGGYVFISLPKSLQVAHAEMTSSRAGRLDLKIQFIGGANLRECYLSDNGYREFTGVLKGVPNLQILDFSYNNFSVISPTVFDVVPRLERLELRQTLLDSEFMGKYSARLFRSLTKLRYLDLSENSINVLAAGSFQNNIALEILILAGNRFQNIPFDLQNLPNLRYLDLRKNSIVDFSVEEMNSIDAQATRVPGFSLLLYENILFCDCSHLHFLYWLQQTHAQLDKQGNYSCFTESGALSSTYTRADVQALGRKCVGLTYLLISIALAATMALAFVLHILVTRYKTQLLSILLQVLSPKFALGKPSQYPIGVYISYSDPETLFACHCLRTLVENDLGMKTFLRDRDLLPASDMAESIVDTVNRSWRVLLIISEEFLYHDLWAYFTMKTAAYTVSPSNPGLLVVLVEDQLRHKLPRCLLRAVDEDSIISLSRQGQLQYEEREKLKIVLAH